jgi:hypothetical protein
VYNTVEEMKPLQDILFVLRYFGEEVRLKGTATHLRGALARENDVILDVSFMWNQVLMNARSAPYFGIEPHDLEEMVLQYLENINLYVKEKPRRQTCTETTEEKINSKRITPAG